MANNYRLDGDIIQCCNTNLKVQQQFVQCTELQELWHTLHFMLQQNQSMKYQFAINNHTYQNNKNVKNNNNNNNSNNNNNNNNNNNHTHSHVHIPNSHNNEPSESSNLASIAQS